MNLKISNKLLAKKLIAFETKIGNLFNKKKIKAPIHLYFGNENHIINIFKKIKKNDWVLCSWRSHYQCLLKGVPNKKLEKSILKGNSIALCFPEHKILEQNWTMIRDEINSILEKTSSLPKFHDVDDGQEFISNNDGIAWKIFLVKTYGFWNKHNIKLCPNIVNLFKPFKNVTSISISFLSPSFCNSKSIIALPALRH